MFGFHIVGSLLPGLFETLFSHFHPEKKKTRNNHQTSYEDTFIYTVEIHNFIIRHSTKIPAWTIQNMVMWYLDTMTSVCQSSSPPTLKWLTLVYYCMKRASTVTTHLCFKKTIYKRVGIEGVKTIYTNRSSCCLYSLDGHCMYQCRTHVHKEQVRINIYSSAGI